MTANLVHNYSDISLTWMANATEHPLPASDLRVVVLYAFTLADSCPGCLMTTWYVSGNGCFPTQYTTGSISSYCQIQCPIYWPLHKIQVGHESKKVGNRSRQNARQNQIFCNFISRKNRTFKLLWMSKILLSFRKQSSVIIRTYMTTPRSTVTAALTGISFPFSSFAFVTLNTESTDEVKMKVSASTK